MLHYIILHYIILHSRYGRVAKPETKALCSRRELRVVSGVLRPTEGAECVWSAKTRCSCAFVWVTLFVLSFRV